MLARQGWRILTSPNSLMAQVLKAKYFPNTTFMKALPNKNGSFAWNSILKGRKVLERGVRWRVGSGKDISIFDEPWLDRDHTPKIISCPEQFRNLKVSDLINTSNNCWNKTLIEKVLNPHDTDIVYGMPVPISNGVDTLYWPYSLDGNYTVKSGSRQIYTRKFLENSGSSSSGSHISSLAFKKLWKMKIPSKVKFCFWRSVHGTLPSTRNLRSRGINCTEKCVFCDSQVESDEHLFKFCHHTQQIWDSLFEPQICYRGTIAYSSWAKEKIVDMSIEDAQKFVTAIWAIWFFRNKRFHKGDLDSPAQIESFIAGKLEEFSLLKPESDRSPKEIPAGPDPPLPPGYSAAFTDGAWLAPSEIGGTGLFIRNHQEEIAAVQARRITGGKSAREMEAEAIWDAVRVANRIGINRLIIFSDAEGLVSEINTALEREATTNRARTGRKIEEIIAMKRQFEDLKLSFIPRSKNRVAHGIAQKSSGISDVQLWLAHFPIWFLHLLSEPPNVDHVP